MNVHYNFHILDISLPRANRNDHNPMKSSRFFCGQTHWPMMEKTWSKCILKNHVDSTAMDSTLQWVKHIVFLLWPALIQNRQAIVQANCIVGLASPRLEVLKQHQKTCIIWCHTCQAQYTKKMSMPKLKAFQLERTFMYNRCFGNIWIHQLLQLLPHRNCTFKEHQTPQ